MLLYIIEDKFEFMKVLITTEWYEPVVNGVVTSVLNLREELTRQGHEVRVPISIPMKTAVCIISVLWAWGKFIPMPGCLCACAIPI